MSVRGPRGRPRRRKTPRYSYRSVAAKLKSRKAVGGEAMAALLKKDAASPCENSRMIAWISGGIGSRSAAVIVPAKLPVPIFGTCDMIRWLAGMGVGRGGR